MRMSNMNIRPSVERSASPEAATPHKSVRVRISTSATRPCSPCSSHSSNKSRPSPAGDGKPRMRMPLLATLGSLMLLLLLHLSLGPDGAPFGLSGFPSSLRSSWPLSRVAPSLPFTMPAQPLPVYTEENRIHYHNLPISAHRPQNQFHVSVAAWNERVDAAQARLVATALASRGGSSPRGPHPGDPRMDSSDVDAIHTMPVITILTVTKNPRPIMRDTHKFITQQSLQNYRWIIIDDHSDNEESIRMLDDIESSGPDRIHLHRNPHPPRSLIMHRRSFALTFVETPYYIFIDDDDMFELTYLEKAVWMLESMHNVELINPYEVHFGAINMTWTKGYIDSLTNYHTNFVLGCAMVARTEAVRGTGCQFDPRITSGGEDWDFLLCLARHGLWGVNLPELSMWYRRNPKKFREERWPNLYKQTDFNMEEYVHEKHKSLLEQGIDTRVALAMDKHELVLWQPPFFNSLAPLHEKPELVRSLLLISPWSGLGGANLAFLRICRTFALRGWKVTVVNMMLRSPASLELIPDFMQYTHDVFVLPHFLRMTDWPRFLVYLIRSRGVSYVLYNNVALLSSLLPALQQQAPVHVRWIDYVHHIEHNWGSGGHARYAVNNGAFLHRTLTASREAAQWLVEQGRSPDSVGVVYVGLDAEEFTPSSSKLQAKRALLAASPLEQGGQVPMLDSLDAAGSASAPVLIVFLARMSREKRPLLALRVLWRILAEYPQAYAVMAGKGALLMDVQALHSQLMEQERARQPQPAALVSARLSLLGAVSDAEKSLLLDAADVYFLPSETEGLCISVAEAMAMRVAVVATHEGGLPELVTPETGTLVELPPDLSALNVKVDESDPRMADAYSDALRVHVDAAPSTRAALGERARARVLSMYQSKLTLATIEDVHFPLAAQAHPSGTPPDAADVVVPRPLMKPHWLLSPRTVLWLFAQSDGYTMDLHQLQAEAAVPALPGYGGKLQVRCGVHSVELRSWIDGVVAAKACDEKRHPVQVSDLQQSAMLQCAHWCIFDVNSQSLDGWQYNGQCFQPFAQITEPTHDCIVKHADLKPH